MTYGVQRMTFTGNTLCDKLKAEFGERTALSLELGREANARRAARNTTPVRRNNGGRANNATAKNPSARPAGHMSNPREFAQRGGAVKGNVRTVPAAQANRRPNIMRDTVVHKMPKPNTGRTPLETSVATFAVAYRRGERIREYAAAERAKPHARPAISTKAKKKSAVVGLISWIRAKIFGEKVHTEVKGRKTPFPVASIFLLGVCTVMVMVMMSSFAQLNEYRNEISQLESRQSALRGEETRLNGLVEAKEDIRAIEQSATEELGMVSSDLVQSRFVSLSSDDRVEMKNTSADEQTGAFSTLLSAIGENIGALSEYFN